MRVLILFHNIFYDLLLEFFFYENYFKDDILVERTIFWILTFQTYIILSIY